MNKPIHITIFLGMLFSAGLSSCIKEMIEEVELPPKWSPEIAFPIGKTTLTVNNYFYNYPSDTTPPEDSLAVYFNNTLYLVDSADLQMADLLPFAFRSFASNPDNIRRLIFRINAYNGYPSLSAYQVYLLDAGYHIIDSLLEGKGMYLTPGVLVNGNEIQKVFSRREIAFSSERIQQDREVEHLRVKTMLVISPSSRDTVRLFPNYQIDVQVGVRIALDVNPDSAINTFQQYQ